MDNVTARRVGETMESLLLVPILRPMVSDCGMIGDYELDLLSGEIARHDRGGFAQLVASRLERGT